MADEGNDKGGIFRDVNAMSVVAPALAAATSFALISRIGLVGSLIGTAITAAVSAAATQVFKNMMADSADRIQELMPDEETLRGMDVPTMTSVTSDAGMTVSTTPLTEAVPDINTEGGSSAGTPDRTNDASASTSPPGGQQTQTNLPQSAEKTVVMTPAASASSIDSTIVRAPVEGKTASLTAVTGTPLADAHARQVATARHARELRRKLTLFSAIVAVVVALVVAGIIATITAGKGLGPTIVIAPYDDDGAKTATGMDDSEDPQVDQTPEGESPTGTSTTSQTNSTTATGTDTTTGTTTGTTEQVTGPQTDSTTGNGETESTTGTDSPTTGSGGTSADGDLDTGTPDDMTSDGASGGTTTDSVSDATGTTTGRSGASTTAL